MNQLNSVIFEGAVHTGINEDGLFTVVNTVFEKVGDDEAVRKVFVECLVVGRFKELYSDKLKEGRNVRIVGKLKEIEGNVGLFVEHIELKPEVIKKGKYTFTKE